MCQYSADEGRATDWHVIHLGHLALSGAALLTIEATAVTPEGRISARDLGLWNDDTERALGQTLESVRRWSDMPIAIQLAHAGRKASTKVPWEGRRRSGPISRAAGRPWRPSPVPFAETEHPPIALDRRGLADIRDAFAAAARRAARLGLDAVQLHGAHGYLLHEFLSPLSNQRDDEYGGSLENRMRFPLEVFDAVREAFPADRPVTHARLRHRLGAGRLGHRADHRLRQGARGARLRRHPRLERRAHAGTEDSARPELSGAAGAGGQGRRRRCRSSPSA